MPITTFIEIFIIHCRWFQPTAFVFNPKPKARKWIMPIAILQWRLLIFIAVGFNQRQRNECFISILGIHCRWFQPTDNNEKTNWL